MHRNFIALLLLAPAPLIAQAPAVNPPVPTTKVLAIGHLVGDGPPDPQAIRSILPSEVRATVNLYLAGKLDQWFVRQDGKGVVFLLNVARSTRRRRC